MLTEKVHKAVVFSEKAHRGQIRKGSGAPYIIHPLSVGIALAGVGASEEVVISGILHDVVEDCDVSLLEIEEIFGKRVSFLVDQVTEKGIGWRERKESVIEKLEEAEKDILLIKSADMLHNISDLVSDIEQVGDKAFDKFHASKEEKIKYCKMVLVKIRNAWPQNPLIKNLEEMIDTLDV